MVLSPRFEQALTYAATLHAGQVRKGTEIPYISHLLIVAGTALEHGADEDGAIAALLHDAVEDQGGKPRLADIRSRFGAPVAEIVEACTDADVIPKPPWRGRKEKYIDHLRQEQRQQVLLVSTCDKLANARAVLNDLRELGPSIFERFNGGREGTLWYYRAVVDVLLTKERSALVDELERVVQEIEAVAKVSA